MRFPASGGYGKVIIPHLSVSWQKKIIIPCCIGFNACFLLLTKSLQRRNIAELWALETVFLCQVYGGRHTICRLSILGMVPTKDTN